MPRHEHRCSTKGCKNYYVCSDRDCRLEWQCPTCDDNELYNDIQLMEQQQQKETVSAQNI